jgi:hypothetical protein
MRLEEKISLFSVVQVAGKFELRSTGGVLHLPYFPFKEGRGIICYTLYRLHKIRSHFRHHPDKYGNLQFIGRRSHTTRVLPVPAPKKYLGSSSIPRSCNLAH